MTGGQGTAIPDGLQQKSVTNILEMFLLCILENIMSSSLIAFLLIDTAPF